MAGQGNPVVFTVDSSSGGGVCTVTGTNGSTVNYTGAGNCVIDANQAGGGGYAAAAQVQQTIPVTALLTQVDQLPGARSGMVGASGHLAGHWGRVGEPCRLHRRPSSDTGRARPAARTGSTVNYLAAGNCVIDANQAGGNGYAPAGQVRRTIPVTALLTQVISFQAPASGVVGGSATLQASGGGSGNPVVFTVDSSSGGGVCTVTGTNGSTVNYTGAGNCVVDANQAGGGGYAPAGQVRRTTRSSRTSWATPGSRRT